jgi:dihydrofolate reductase
MGRKTWDSLPPRFRPLPGRVNIVVTRQPGWQAPGALRAASLQDALALCPADADAWVMGGAEIYRGALPLAHTAVVTEIDADFEGDAHAPQFGPAWQEIRRERHLAANGLAFSFVTYQNTTPGD